MTIPIIPGPFSFLAGAGEALGAYGTQREEHRRYAQDTARKALEHWDNLVQIGIFPAKSMQSPEYGHLTDLAGFGAAPTGEILPQPKEERAREIAALPPGARRDIALDIPTEAAGMEQDIKARAMKQITPGGAAERAFAGVEAEPVAGAKEAATQAGATAQATAADFQTRITQGAVKMFGDDPQIQQIAQWAATPGVLDYKLAQLQERWHMLSEQRQFRATNTQLLLGAMKEGVAVYNDDLTKWARHRDQAVQAKATQLRGVMNQFQIGHQKQEEIDAFRAKLDQELQAFSDSWEASNPQPAFEDSFKNTLQTVYHMGPDEYSDFIKGGLELGDPETARRQKGKPTPTPKPAGAPAPDPRQRIGSAMRAAAIGDPSVNGRLFAEHVKKRDYTDVEAHQVLAHLERYMPPDAYAKFQAAYDEAVK